MGIKCAMPNQSIQGEQYVHRGFSALGSNEWSGVKKGNGKVRALRGKQDLEDSLVDRDQVGRMSRGYMRFTG